MSAAGNGDGDDDEDGDDDVLVKGNGKDAA